MFFTLSKILSFFALPSNDLVLLIAIATVLLFTRYARAGRRLLVLSVAALVIVGLSPLGRALTQALEDRFPAWDASRGAPAGFIVLGGAVNPYLSAVRGTTVLDGSAERITIVAELARRYPAAKIVYSGGNASLMGGPAEADYVMRLFESFGVAPERILLERKSRNTHENAVFSKELAAPQPGERWAVVTSGVHMPRAIGSFRAAGFSVEAYPVDWHTTGATESFGLTRAFVAGLAETDSAVREFVGLAMYRLTGRSSELFPAPR